MDLGIAGKVAIVCGGSKGLGRGVAEKLAEAGVDIILNARSQPQLEKTASEIARRFGVKVIPVAADVSTSEGRGKLLAANRAPDILINNAGGPPAGMWNEWDDENWQSALGANMLAPIHLMKAVLPGMIEKRWGRIVNITSSSVKSPIAVLGLSGAARCGLTGYVAGTSRQVARHGVTINNLMPGSHATDRMEMLVAKTAADKGITVEQAQREACDANPTGRFGTPLEFGSMCAFLCSAHAGYIVGQNILLDGGAFNSTM